MDTLKESLEMAKIIGGKGDLSTPNLADNEMDKSSKLSSNACKSSPVGYKRKGKLILMKEKEGTHLTNQGNANQAAQVVQIEKGNAILDMKWSNHTPLLASATADGETIIYSLSKTNLLSDENSSNTIRNNSMNDSLFDTDHKSLNIIKTHQNSTKSLVLSLDWSLDSTKIASSQSNGFLQIINLENNCITLNEWKAHDFEAWITCYDPNNPEILYSGGDDCKFKVWDERVGFAFPTLINKTSHSAGVTTISRDPHFEFSIATGSYDDQVRLWDSRMLKDPISFFETGGGVWRIKFHPSDPRFIAVASMYNGFHILQRYADFHDSGLNQTEYGQSVKKRPQQAQTLSLSLEFKKHKSIAYGIDWSRHSGRLGTCSFYDHLFCLWRP